MSQIWPYVAGILPTILVATLFYFLIKGMIEGDRRERVAQARFEAEQDRSRRTAHSQPSESVVDQDGSSPMADRESSAPKSGIDPEPPGSQAENS